MIQDGDGNCEHMVEQLRLQVGEAAEVLSRKKISLAQVQSTYPML